MKNWIAKVKYYLNSFIEVGVLLLGVSVIAEATLGPNITSAITDTPSKRTPTSIKLFK
jgi:hypothetical protein